MVSRIGSDGLLPSIRPHSMAPRDDAESFAQSLEHAAERASRSEGPTPQDEQQLRAAVHDVEAFFIKEMVASMRKAIPKGGLFDQSFAKETYEGMLDDELAKEMARAGGIGLGELLYRQLIDDRR